MDLSVVIPVHNGGHTLGAMLRSVAEQSVDAEWEVLIANDHSTDHTADVARSWAGLIPHLRVVEVEGRGVAAARNVGTAASSGDLVVYVDADDTLEPGYLQAMLTASEGADLLTGRLAEIRPLDSPPVAPEPGLPALHGFLPFARGCSLSVTRRAFDTVGGFVEDLGGAGAEDVDFSWRVQLAGFRLDEVVGAVVNYHHRDDVRSLFWQRFRWAETDVELIRRHAGNGARPRSTVKALRHWAWLIVHVPDLRNRPGRMAWIGTLAAVSGRLSGSLRYRFYAP